MTRHDLPEGRPIWSRHGHVQNMVVSAGQSVKRGDKLAHIGNAFGRYPYHLHWDGAWIDLGDRPSDWRGIKLQRVKRDYVNMIEFVCARYVVEHRPSRTQTSVDRVRLRRSPSMSDLSNVIGVLPLGTSMRLLWRSGGMAAAELDQPFLSLKQGFVAERYLTIGEN